MCSKSENPFQEEKFLSKKVFYYTPCIAVNMTRVRIEVTNFQLNIYTQVINNMFNKLKRMVAMIQIIIEENLKFISNELNKIL